MNHILVVDYLLGCFDRDLLRSVGSFVVLWRGFELEIEDCTLFVLDDGPLLSFS